MDLSVIGRNKPLAIKCVLVAITLIIMAIVALPHVQAYAASSGGGSNNDEPAQRSSFSKVVEYSSVYLDNLFRSGNYGMLSENGFPVANAGGGVGFVPDDSELADLGYTFNFFNPTETNATVSYSYAAFAPYGKSVDAGQKIVLEGLTGYARYGYMLSKMGFDDTSAIGDNAAIRNIFGFGLWGTWWLANTAHSLLGLVYRGIASLNPIAAFANSSQAASFGGTDDSIFSNAGGLSTMLGNLYDIMRNIGQIVVVPLLLAVFIFMVTVGRVIFQARFNWTRARNLIVRVAFIVIGVPLMAILFHIL